MVALSSPARMAFLLGAERLVTKGWSCILGAILLHSPVVSATEAASYGGTTGPWTCLPRAQYPGKEPEHHSGGCGQSGLGCLLQCPGLFLRREQRLQPVPHLLPSIGGEP